MSNKTSKQISKNSNSGILAQMMRVERSSILPPPEEMERYEKLRPGITDVLLNSFQDQTKHRIEIENKVIESGIKNSRLGQIFAFILSLIVILGGFGMIFLGKNIAGMVAVLGALATLSGVFIVGNKSKKDERIQKENLNR